MIRSRFLRAAQRALSQRYGIPAERDAIIAGSGALSNTARFVPEIRSKYSCLATRLVARLKNLSKRETSP
jgi:ribose 1,5-bisphosphokinase PhnN